ncbi:MAG: hypothetical protein HZA50_11955 [Planctomycetes bacterium]|nr:hypothetical protein [Planctomycetota bacterium]
MSGRISTSSIARLVLAGVFAACACQAFSDGKPQPKAAPTVEQRLAPFIAAIKETKDPATALTCYVKGCSIDNTSLAIHETYMKRMLSLGLPQYAEMPAKVLVNLDPRNGTAWGVIGCMNGKRGDYGAALPACIRAAALLPNDAGIMNNAGQLMVWYENTLDAPELPDALKRILDNLRNKWDQNEAFARSYKKVRDAYIARDKLDKETGDKMATLEDATLAVQRNYLDVQAKLMDISSQIQNKQTEALYMYRQMLNAPPFIVSGGLAPISWPTVNYGNYGGFYPYFPGGGGFWPWFGDGLSIGFAGTWGDFSMAGSFNNSYYPGPFFGGGFGGGLGGAMPMAGPGGGPVGHGGGGHGHDHGHHRRHRDPDPWPWPYPYYYPGNFGYMPYAGDYFRQIGDLTSSINQLKSTGVSLQSDSNELKAELDRKKKSMAKLLKQAGLVDRLLTRNFRWDPPSVDGALTPEVDNYVMGTPKGPIPKDPEGEAERLLNLAKMHISVQDHLKASEAINKLLTDYPDTVAGRQAEKLIRDDANVRQPAKK